MPKRVAVLFVLLLSFACPALEVAQGQVSVDDEIRAGQSLLVSFKKAQGFSDTEESKSIEAYLQKVGDKIAKNAKRKLAYKFYFDPHPAFRSAVAYPGGIIIVGGGSLALMAHEDELAVVLGHEIAHVDLNQCANRVSTAMARDHLTPAELDKLSIEEFGGPYGKQGELDADREGMELAVAAGYSPHAAIELLEVYQFLSRNTKPAPRKDAPSLEERIEQAKGLIKSHNWTESKAEVPLTFE